MRLGESASMKQLLALLSLLGVALSGPVLLLSRPMPQELGTYDETDHLALLRAEPMAVREFCLMGCFVNRLCGSFRAVDGSCELFAGVGQAVEQPMTTACSSAPCVHDAECLPLSDGTFTCLCPAQFTGATCNLHRNDTWSAWSGWSVCSVTCEEGVKRRTRSCPDRCDGEAEEMAVCYGAQCPAMTAWSEWSNCTTDNRCGRGTRNRTRKCVGDCLGPEVESIVCVSVSCGADAAPVRLGPTGAVSLFDDKLGSLRPVCDQNWNTTAANVVCKEMGSSGVGRVSTTTSSEMVGQPIFLQKCTGNETTLQGCGRTTSQSGSNCSAYAVVTCLIKPQWSLWSQWESCSVTCEAGIQQRRRECLGSSGCKGNSTDSQPCDKGACPEWSDWGPCSVSCDFGVRRRKHNCPRGVCITTVKPENVPLEEPCYLRHCPINGTWSEWTDWTPCSVTCGHAEQTRLRNCTPPQYDGADCGGLPVQVLLCPLPSCPIDGAWTAWSPWAPCTVTCAGGTTSRNRTCVGPFFGGRSCDGPNLESDNCNAHDCPFPATCTQYKERGSTTSGFYMIDPINQTGQTAFQVFCQMSSSVGVATINHDLMNELHIHDFQYEEPVYPMDGIFITYDTGLANAIRLAKSSLYCQQYIRWRCRNAKMAKAPGDTRILDDTIDPVAAVRYTFWQNRDGQFRAYWGGAPPGSQVCSCGTPLLNCTAPSSTCKSTCLNTRLTCNCDSKLNSWSEDSGYLSFIDDLPVSAVNPGDTGDAKEEGYLSLGPLECRGSNRLVN